MADLAVLLILGGFIAFIIVLIKHGEPGDFGDLGVDEVYTDHTDIPRPTWADEIILTGSQVLVFRNEKKGLEEVWVFEDGVWRRR